MTFLITTTNIIPNLTISIFHNFPDCWKPQQINGKFKKATKYLNSPVLVNFNELSSLHSGVEIDSINNMWEHCSNGRDKYLGFGMNRSPVLKQESNHVQLSKVTGGMQRSVASLQQTLPHYTGQDRQNNMYILIMQYREINNVHRFCLPSMLWHW